MLPWGRQQIAICSDCNAKLAGATAPEAYCAFYDVDPTDLLPRGRSPASCSRPGSCRVGSSSGATAPVPPRPDTTGCHTPVPVPDVPGQATHGTALTTGTDRFLPASPTP